VYVSGGDRLQKFDARGNFITMWAIPEPAGVAVGPDGSVYVVDPTIPKSYNIQKFDGNGHFLLKWGESGSGDGQFECPTGVAVGSDGSVYVADTCNNRIQKFDPEGKFLAKWGTSGNGDR
jgi:DNA-binding beta-propeller fold protein YncE